MSIQYAQSHVRLAGTLRWPAERSHDQPVLCTG